MDFSDDAVLLRIFLAEDDLHEHRLLYAAIVEKALEMKMAGATVLPGPQGFGHSRRVRSELNVESRPHGPVVVEIVDGEARIERFLPVLDGMLESGLVTLEKVRARHYRPGPDED